LGSAGLGHGERMGGEMGMADDIILFEEGKD
jgi:hypothetical protein